ncbi:MAG TPA: TIGR02453 family protein [Acidimicrobiia bacterium]|nr:TIGR02453 family protein [Acidimicrobiia bacterium]
MGTRYFTPKLFWFLRELAANNDREWFTAHKSDYETHLREPALRFITDLVEPFSRISSHFTVEASKVGGSLVRIQRDTRFSRDSSPYRTYLGIGIRHERFEEVHTPRFYLVIQPRASYLGVGSWRPDAQTAHEIRLAVSERPDSWEAAVGSDGFSQHFTLEGESLKRPPRGFEPDHPLIAYLQRKDFAAVTRFNQRDITSDGFLDQFVARCEEAAPLAEFLCQGVGVEF